MADPMIGRTEFRVPEIIAAALCFYRILHEVDADNDFLPIVPMKQFLFACRCWQGSVEQELYLYYYVYI